MSPNIFTRAIFLLISFYSSMFLSFTVYLASMVDRSALFVLPWPNTFITQSTINARLLYNHLLLKAWQRKHHLKIWYTPSIFQNSFAVPEQGFLTCLPPPTMGLSSSLETFPISFSPDFNFLPTSPLLSWQKTTSNFLPRYHEDYFGSLLQPSHSKPYLVVILDFINKKKRPI